LSTNSLQIGYACADITPPGDCPLLGYTQRIHLHKRSGNDGILDPLHVRVTLIDNGTERAALLSFDLCILETPAADSLRSQISELIGSAPHHIILAATHTHSGPYPWAKEWADTPHEPVPEILHADPSIRYWQQLQASVRHAVKEALADLAPTRLRAHTASLGFAYKRRVKTDNGIEMCWNPKETPERPIQPADDQTLTVLEMSRENGDHLLFNIAAHPVVLGKYSNRISADWPGAACRQIELALPGARAAFFHGAGGDAHPKLATDNCPEDLDAVAAPVATLATLLKKSGGLYSEHNDFVAKEGLFSFAENHIRMSAWRIGPLRILAFPGELFGSSGCWLREQVDGPLILSTTSNGWSGYWPPIEAFDDGGYETNAVLDFGVCRGDTERMLAYAKDLLQEV